MELVKQDDGTYDMVGLTQEQLDMMCTALGASGGDPVRIMHRNDCGDVDEKGYQLYIALRDGGGTYHNEWVK